MGAHPTAKEPPMTTQPPRHSAPCDPADDALDEAAATIWAHTPLATVDRELAKIGTGKHSRVSPASILNEQIRHLTIAVEVATSKRRAAA